MNVPDIPANESDRLRALCALDVLDTPAEARFDRITRVAQRHFGVQIALISLVDARRQWFKSHQGLDAIETARDISFCGHAILSEDVLYVPDAAEDPRFADNPLVTGGPKVRFYAGAPLHAPGGERVGTLCIIDPWPRKMDSDDIAVLRDLADCVEAELERTRLLAQAKHMRLAQNRLSTVIDTVVDGIVTIDCHGVIQSFNRAAERIFAYAAADVIGRNVNILMPEPYRTAHDGYLQHYLSTGQRKVIGFGREVTGQRQDGSTFPMDIAVSEMEADDERSFTGIVRDITERKRLERTRRHQEAILQSSADAIISRSLNGIIFSWNQGAENMFGYRADEAIGQPILMLYPDNPGDKESTILARILRKERIEHFETVRRCKDGSLIDISVTMSPIVDDLGMVVCISEMARDITARKRTEADLAEQRRRLSDIIEGTNVGTWEWNLQTGSILVDEHWANMLGFTLAELEPVSVDTWIGLSHLSDLARSKQMLKEHFSGQSDHYECELRMRHKDGHWVWLLGRGRLSSRTPEGKPLLISGTHQDISSQKADQALLAAAHSQAEAANLAKTAFLANMSHEIRSPLNAILGLAYLLEQSNLDLDARVMVRKIRDSGRMLLDIISDILDMSKIEAGQMLIEQAPFELETVIDSVATALELAIGKKDIALIFSPVPAGVCTVVGDATRLQQVLVNFCSNAAKFTQTGQIALRIALLNGTGESESLRFSVHDSGVGIAPELQQDVFQAFVQADTSITRRFGGTGLGLAICRQLVSLMGGEIGLSSVPGQGSEFWFTLPLKRLGAAQYSPPELGQLEVLIVDDSDLSLQSMSIVAQHLGWQVSKVDSGAAALYRVLENNSAKRPDVVLLDWRMPGMNGLIVARAIRAGIPAGECPLVIIATAHSIASLLSEPGAELADAFLSKPVTASALYDAVLQAHRHRSATERSLPSTVPANGDLLAGVRLLVVDDSDINRDVAQRILSRAGATVMLAEDGQHAIDWLLAHPFEVDLVLMDIQMPVLDGIEATRRLRGRPEFDDLPIVALSAGAFESQQQAAMAAGMTEFVSKPFDVPLTVALIQRLRRPSKLLAAGPETAPAAAPAAAPAVASAATSFDAVALPALASAPASTSVSASDARAPAGVMNTEQGLVIWSDLPTYQTYLRRFASRYRDAVALLHTSLSRGDRFGAIALVHKMSGVAANLALPDTHSAAQQAEQRLSTQDDPEPALLELSQALAAVFAEIERYAPGIELGAEARDTAGMASASASSLSAAGQVKLKTQLTRLLLALDSDNPVRVKGEMAMLEQQLPAPVLAAIWVSVLDYDLQGAAIRTRQLAIDYAIDLGD